MSWWLTMMIQRTDKIKRLNASTTYHTSKRSLQHEYQIAHKLEVHRAIAIEFLNEMMLSNGWHSSSCSCSTRFRNNIAVKVCWFGCWRLNSCRLCAGVKPALSTICWFQWWRNEWRWSTSNVFVIWQNLRPLSVWNVIILFLAQSCSNRFSYIRNRFSSIKHARPSRPRVLLQTR